ncbi:MAG: hypothetical protein AAGK04_06585, partial [Planctomycetota bacterium]
MLRGAFHRFGLRGRSAKSVHERAGRGPEMFDQLECRKLLAAFVVDSPTDLTANDGLTTLREAIVLANDNGASDDTITFAAGLAGSTITLTQGELSITDGVQIR